MVPSIEFLHRILRCRRGARLTGGLLGVFGVLAVCSTASANALEDGLEASQAGDFAVAYCLWRPLADHGDVEAQYRLAWLYANGQGLRQNPEVAADWWHRAALQGHVDAQAALGNVYRRGRGRARSEAEAVKWLLAAARGGNDEAQAMLRNMAGDGDAAAVTVVSELLAAQDWKVLGATRAIKADRANLRERPSTSAKIAGRVERGDQVLVLRRSGDWLRVVVVAREQFAWIFARLVAPAPAEPTTDPSTRK